MAENDGGADAAERTSRTLSRSPWARKRVLLVDTVPGCRNLPLLVTWTLERGGYDLTFVPSSDLLTRAQADRPDALVVSGGSADRRAVHALLGAIRSLPGFETTPVVVLWTGRAADIRELEGVVDQPGVSLITTPFSALELRQELLRVLPTGYVATLPDP